MEIQNVLNDGRKQTAVFCSKVYSGRLGFWVESVVDHLAFEDRLTRNYHENGIFVNC